MIKATFAALAVVMTLGAGSASAQAVPDQWNYITQNNVALQYELAELLSEVTGDEVTRLSSHIFVKEVLGLTTNEVWAMFGDMNSGRGTAEHSRTLTNIIFAVDQAADAFIVADLAAIEAARVADEEAAQALADEIAHAAKVNAIMIPYINARNELIALLGDITQADVHTGNFHMYTASVLGIGIVELNSTYGVASGKASVEHTQILITLKAAVEQHQIDVAEAVIAAAEAAVEAAEAAVEAAEAREVALTAEIAAQTAAMIQAETDARIAIQTAINEAQASIVDRVNFLTGGDFRFEDVGTPLASLLNESDAYALTVEVYQGVDGIADVMSRLDHNVLVTDLGDGTSLVSQRHLSGVGAYIVTN